MYDFAHPLSDAIEGVTHSICTLEFDVHRPLYDWLVDKLYTGPRPYQYEMGRLNLDYSENYSPSSTTGSCRVGMILACRRLRVSVARAFRLRPSSGSARWWGLHEARAELRWT